MIRHLVDKETAIKDMVTDFSNQGNRLVEGYEKALEEQIDSYRAHNDRRQLELVEVFEKAEADRATTSKAVTKRSVRSLQAQRETQQKALMSKNDCSIGGLR